MIIADVALLGTSGIEFCKKLLRYKVIPVIFLTAKDDEADIWEGYEAGCQEYVTKPVSPKVLLSKTEVILKRDDSKNVLEYKGLKVDFDKRKIWDMDSNFVDDYALIVVINRLRKKIEQSSSTPIYIKYVFGIEYTFGE